MVEDDVVGRIVGLADLLQDHATLALHLVRIEGRMGQDVADDVGPQRHVLLQHLYVISGLLTRRVGVDMAADILDLLGDRHRRALFGALERHMLEEMRGAVLAGVLVAGAGGDVGAERDGLDAVHPFADDGEAGGQPGDADGVGFGGHAAFLNTVARTWASTAARSAGTRV